jgi:predicted dehydrogenase
MEEIMKKVRTAVIGLGSRGRGFAKNMLESSRYELDCIIDCDRQNIEGAIKFLKQDVPFYYSLEKALELGAFEAVVIATPDNTHGDIAEACFNAGKDVLCEKPLEITVEKCDRILKAAQESNKVLVVGFVMRYMRSLQQMKELIDKGEIGKVVSAYANHEVSTGSRWYFHDWHAQQKYSNGLLLQKGSHDLDILNWLIGQKPVQVAAMGGLNVFGGNEKNSKTCAECEKADSCPDYTTHIDHHPDMSKPIQCVYRKEVDVEDNHLVIVEYESGARASYTECHFSPRDKRTFCVIGSEGCIEYDGELKLIKRYPKDVVRYEMEPVAGGHSGGDTGLLKDFYDAIVNKTPPLADGMAGRTSVALAIAAHQSMREGRIVKLN